MTEKKPFMPSRVASMNDTSPVSCSWESIVSEIKGDSLLSVTTAYRTALRRRQEAEAQSDGPTASEATARMRKLKTALPSFLPSAEVSGGRAAKDVVGVSGFIMVDIDHIPPTLLHSTVEAVKADSHTFLAYVTVSGLGLRVIARVGEKLDDHTFKRAWTAVNAYYADLTGLPTDRQCRNLTRISGLCRDPDVCYRPDAATFTAADIARLGNTHTAAGKALKGRRTTAAAAEQTVRRLVESDGTAYAPGQHNRYVAACLYWMNRFGVALDEATRWALKAFADYDEHDTCKISDFRTGADRRGGTDKTSRCKATAPEIRAFLEGRVRARLNVFSHKVEISRDQGPWEMVTDRTENSLWTEMQAEGVMADPFQIHNFLASDFAEEFNPLVSYLDGLEPWDGATDHIGRLARMVSVKGDHALFDDALRRWLVAMLAGALSEQVVNHTILTLIGKQGGFKTSFVNNILPPALRPYLTTKLNTQSFSRDDLFTTTEYLIINCEEIDAMQTAELNKLKAIVTQLYVNERQAYGRNKVRLPHIASFIATGNNTTFLTDDTGNRRWMPFEVEHIDNPYTAEIDHDGVYAQAYHMLKNGYKYWFDSEDIDVRKNHISRFESPRAEYELILSHFRRPRENEQASYLTSTQILMRFGNCGVRLSAVKMGRAMKELGFEQVVIHKGRFWKVVERTANDVQHTLPTTPDSDDEPPF